jgi:NTE family protein
MSFGVALSGGGIRGAAHVGVLLALEESGLFPSSIAGTSAGGIVAGLYAMGISSKELREIVLLLSKNEYSLIDADYLGILMSVVQLFSKKPVTLSGLIKGNKLESYLFQLTQGKNIKNAKIKIVIPTVDLRSGLTIAYTNSLIGVKPIKKVRWESDIPICEAMRASSSVPAVFQPKIIDKMCLVDGGASDILPVNLLIAAGEKNVLSVDVGRDYHAPKINNIIEISSHSLSILSSCLKEYISSGEKLLLKPSLPQESGLLTFSYLVECMDAGYEATKAMISSIRSVLI